MSDTRDTTNANTNDTNRNTSSEISAVEPFRSRRIDPFSMLNDVELAMDRMFGRRLPLFRPLHRIVDTDAGWTPHVDMYEEGESLVVKAELPGVSKDDIDVSLDHGDLVLKGERKSEHEAKEENYYRMERSFGTFYRRLPMPEGIKEDQISASFNDGVLEIRAPKPASEAASPKKIAIQ